jgi:hypothetical protein
MKKECLAFMTVKYEDGLPTFDAIEVSYDDKVKRFDTGDPLIDWYDYCKFVYQGEAKEEGIVSIGCSSSYDHWFMDSEDYVEKYLKLIDDEYYDFYTSEELDSMSISEIRKHMKCVIRNDMKSFKELTDYYSKNKSKYKKTN